VETPHPFAIRHIPPQASMGPRFCKRGNYPCARCNNHCQHASMGPRFCERGKEDGNWRVEHWSEPLQWGHAFVSVETSASTHPPAHWRCFNGATLL